MRVRCTDDEDGDILPDVESLAIGDDDSINHFGEINMSAKKKEAAAAEESKDTKKAAKAKTDKKAEKDAGGKKESKTKKELPEGFGPREVPEGYTGLAAIAEKVGRTPAACRRVLRAAEVSKPEGQHGWYWKDGSKDLAKIEKLLAKEEAEA